MKKKMCLIGININHSLSPKMYNEYFKTNNIDIEYSLSEIFDLKTFITKKSKEYIAFNVTYPYKEEIIKYLNNDKDFTNEAINLVINSNNKLIGYNTDGIGFYESLIENEIEVNNKKITIIGYGGAGKSICKYLLNNTNAKINIITHNDSIKLYENNSNKNQIFNLISKNTDILVNASSCGFKNEDESPIPKNLIKELYNNNKNIIYVDIIYSNKTFLIKYFERLGVKTIDGHSMLKFQFLNNLKILKNNNIF